MNDVGTLPATPHIDPVTLEILGHQFRAAAEEMGIALSRTARTTYVREAADFGTALATPGGKFFGYPAALGVSGFLDLDAGPALRAAGPYEEGDVVLTNHPYDSGGLSSHMPDLQLLRPYFHDGRIVAIGWAFVHTADIGGMVPSSIAPDLNELFQEGLILPPLKLVNAGEMNADVVTLYRANCRMPDANMGDIQAMLTALDTGARRVADLITRHGIDVFVAGQQALADYAKAKATAVRRRIPDGSYTFWDYLDDDYVSKIPVRVRCKMTVSDGTIHLDFTGTDPQVPAAYNVPTGGVRHPWLTLRLMQFVASYDHTIPMNHGLFEGITVTVPKGSLLNPIFPAAVGIRSAPAIRIGDVMTGCLALAAPELIPAPSGGTVVPTVLAEYDAALGTRRVQVMQSLVGGTGARMGADGVDGRDTSLANCFNTPTEASEAEVGAVVTHYGLRPGSGGPGKWRGGTGLIFTMRIDQAGSAVLGRGLERYVFRPFGLMGGRPGAPARVILNLGRSGERELGKISMVEPEPGDTVTLMSAGGGGYGDPFERPIERVMQDVRAGFVSVDEARRDYGVVVVDQEVDHAETSSLRNAPRDPPARFSLGPERAAWDRVFTDARMMKLVSALLTRPPALATRLRQQLFDALLPELGRVPIETLLAEPDAIGNRLDVLITKITED
ncbi:hydantoinase B/oxoprolinase family protein [Roseobacter sp.]|uniref:hydantoinase B/oxoprolinase family protein n=1 Tax=Roseobacter sp. TaxID=1907202 RepID=UPI00385A4B15